MLFFFLFKGILVNSMKYEKCLLFSMHRGPNVGSDQDLLFDLDYGSCINDTDPAFCLICAKIINRIYTIQFFPLICFCKKTQSDFMMKSK